MGIIDSRVREAFKVFDKTQDIYTFASEMARIGDYSVRSMTHWYALIDSINNVKKERESDEVREKRGKEN